MKNNIFEYMNLRFDDSFLCDKESGILLPKYLDKRYELYNMEVLGYKCLLVNVKEHVTIDKVIKHIRSTSESGDIILWVHIHNLNYIYF